MKRALAVVMAVGMMLAWGVATSSAQQVTWEAQAFDLVSTSLTEFAGNGSVYGIASGQIVEIDLGKAITVTAAASTNPFDLTSATDLVVSPKGTVFAINGTTVLAWTAEKGFTAVTKPNLPTDGKEIIPGTFTHITYGAGGRLLVLYEADGGHQYILAGYEVSSGMTVSITPATLNLGSNGKWVTCKLGLPEGYSAKDINPDTVEITKLYEAKQGDMVVSIFRDPNSPASASTKYLTVKFSRAALQAGLEPLKKNKGTYQVTATVKAQLKSGEWFEGTGSFQALVPKGKK